MEGECGVLSRACRLTLLGVSLVAAGCGTASLPDMQVEMDRVDSLSAEIMEGSLLLTALCSGGIGSFTIVFNEPVSSDSIVLTLLYDDGMPYRQCENLEISVSIDSSAMEYLRPPGGISLQQGKMVQPTGFSLKEITVFWIDFYRS